VSAAWIVAAEIARGGRLVHIRLQNRELNAAEPRHDVVLARAASQAVRRPRATARRRRDGPAVSLMVFEIIEVEVEYRERRRTAPARGERLPDALE